VDFKPRSKRNGQDDQPTIEGIYGKKTSVDDDWSGLAERVKRQAAEDIARNRYHKPSKKHVDEKEERVEVNIRLSLPRFELDRLREIYKSVITYIKSHLSGVSFSRKKVIITSVFCLALITVPAYLLLKKDDPEASVQGSSTAAEASQPGHDIVPSKDIKFDTVLPRGRNIPDDKLFYDAKRNFVRYDDQINAVKISVSQQPLPEAFKSDPDGNAKRIAADFSATEMLSMEGQNMYYGVSEKGPQTMILTKNDVLIFINTTTMIEKESLKAYAYNLD
jgi:hypothetical protein